MMMKMLLLHNYQIALLKKEPNVLTRTGRKVKAPFRGLSQKRSTSNKAWDFEEEVELKTLKRVSCHLIVNSV